MNYQNIIFDWLNKYMNTLSVTNRQQICYFKNNMPRPLVIGSHFDWTKRQENTHILRMRENSFNDAFLINNWDRMDKELHSFLKRFIDIL